MNSREVATTTPAALTATMRYRSIPGADGAVTAIVHLPAALSLDREPRTCQRPASKRSRRTLVADATGARLPLSENTVLGRTFAGAVTLTAGRGASTVSVKVRL